MIVYATAVDQGDGSLGIRFFESQACIDWAEDRDPESFRGGEGMELDVNDVVPETLEELQAEYEGWDD